MTITTPTTELEAVNAMLAAIGEAPINSLIQSGLADAILAQTILGQVCREVQSRGWQFNTETEFPITANVNKTISVPQNAIEISIADSMKVNWLITQRAGKIYDLTNHTFSIGQTLKFNIKWLFTFEDCPEAFRWYVTVRAARMFIDRTVGNETIHGYAESDETTALAVLKQSEALTADYNILVGNYSVFRALDRMSSSSGTLIQQ